MLTDRKLIRTQCSSLKKEGREAEFLITLPVMATGFSLLPLLLFLPVVLDFLLAGTSYFSLVGSPRSGPSDPQSMLISIILAVVFDFYVLFSVCL